MAAVLKSCIALSRRRTKENLAANRHSADVGRQVRAELKRISLANFAPNRSTQNLTVS